MYKPTYENVHNQFQLNGFHLNKEDLRRVAFSFIKEGEDFEKPVGDFLLDWFDDREYMEVLTSGSTGVPKLIKIDKQAMVNSAIATGDFFNLHPGNRVLNCLPVKFIAGKMMFIRAMVLGWNMDFVAPSSRPLENNDNDYDFVAMVPLQAQHSLKELARVKKMIVGGAKMSNKLENALSKLPTEVYETYGMTETITHIAARRTGEKAFSVLPDVTISADQRSCLIIRAPKISEETIVTNDIVELQSDNRFVFLGRYDNIINSGGIKLIPEQIEEKLSGKIDGRFFVIGRPDPTLGEKLVLVVEGKVRQIDPAVFDVLDKYEKPKEIFFVPQFKETPTQKILRAASLE